MGGLLSSVFPGGRRHDLEALAAYFRYKELPCEIADDGERAAEAVEAWEDEGGSTS